MQLQQQQALVHSSPAATVTPAASAGTAASFALSHYLPSELCCVRYHHWNVICTRHYAGLRLLMSPTELTDADGETLRKQLHQWQVDVRALATTKEALRIYELVMLEEIAMAFAITESSETFQVKLRRRAGRTASLVHDGDDGRWAMVAKLVAEHLGLNHAVTDLKAAFGERCTAHRLLALGRALITYCAAHRCRFLGTGAGGDAAMPEKAHVLAEIGPALSSLTGDSLLRLVNTGRSSDNSEEMNEALVYFLKEASISTLAGREIALKDWSIMRFQQNIMNRLLKKKLSGDNTRIVMDVRASLSDERVSFDEAVSLTVPRRGRRGAGARIEGLGQSLPTRYGAYMSVQECI
jgi:hypothetical protein